jgi:hypothetical protein
MRIDAVCSVPLVLSVLALSKSGRRAGKRVGNDEKYTNVSFAAAGAAPGVDSGIHRILAYAAPGLSQVSATERLRPCRLAL